MAESIQPYTPARVDYLARYLQTQLPGLNYELAVKWIKAEQGENGNVLGVTYDAAPGTTGYQGTLYRYPTQEEGIRQAAALVKRSGNYAGIRASLGQSYTAQAQALVASPWNVRNSRYYARLFGIAPLSGVVPASTGTGALTGSHERERTLVWGVPEGTILRARDVETIIASLVSANLLRDMGSTNEFPFQETNIVRRILMSEVGQPWNGLTRGRLQVKLNTEAAAQPTDPGKALGAIGEAIVPQPLRDAAAFAGDIGAFLFDTENWKYAGALVVGVPLALLGFYLLAGVPTAGQNA